MAGCRRSRVIAQPASASFCSPQLKLTAPVGCLQETVLPLSGEFYFFHAPTSASAIGYRPNFTSSYCCKLWAKGVLTRA
jgi:hypothetical protein